MNVNFLSHHLSLAILEPLTVTGPANLTLAIVQATTLIHFLTTLKLLLKLHIIDDLITLIRMELLDCEDHLTRQQRVVPLVKLLDFFPLCGLAGGGVLAAFATVALESWIISLALGILISLFQQTEVDIEDLLDIIVLSIRLLF